MVTTEYVTTADGVELYRGDSLESAIRAWDGGTYTGRASGGITVQSWHGGVMVRDGNVLHVQDNGVVYLNPNLISA